MRIAIHTSRTGNAPSMPTLRAPPAPLLLLAALCACGDDGAASTDPGHGSTSGEGTDTTQTPQTGADGSTGGVEQEPCTPIGFTQHSTFVLPPGLGPLDNARSGGDCDEGLDRWVVRDMDGDGLRDLVVTTECDDETPGASWTVYPGTPSGFSAESFEWALPDSHGEPDYYGGMGCSTCKYQVRDVDGDGVQDMLVAYVLAELDDGHWWLHRGTETGFDHDGIPYPLPPGNMLLWSVGDSHCFVPPPTQSDQWFPEFFVEDYTGDQRLDLIVEPECDASTDPPAVVDVYTGGPTGFAAAPTAWSMPQPQPTTCESSTLDSGVFDLDGDGRLEYVDPQGCHGTEECAPSQWLVYEPRADGFTAEPIEYEVPSNVACRGLVDPPSSRVHWADFTFDGVPDALVAESSTGAWVLDRGRADGLELGVEVDPPMVGGQPLDALEPGMGEELRYELVRLDESLPPAIVVTGDPDDASVGATHWDVYGFECAEP